jgi:hypothetical protein
VRVGDPGLGQGDDHQAQRQCCQQLSEAFHHFEPPPHFGLKRSPQKTAERQGNFGQLLKKLNRFLLL